MSLSKAKTLLSRMGEGLSDSVGVRAGESTTPVYADASGIPPRADFVRSRSVGDISVDEIIPDPEQPRKHFEPEDIERLAEDIKTRGQLQPIRVRWDEALGKWLIIAGERRWRAVKHAGLPKITCIFVDRKMSENEIRTEQLVENLHREDLKGIELARSFSTLMELNGWSATQLSEELHLSKARVSKALSLLKLPEDIQAKVEDGTIPPSTAYEIAKAKGDKAQRELAEKAIAGHVTHAEAAKETKGRGAATGKKRRTTNETFRTSDGVKVVVSSRRHIGHDGIIQALIEAAEEIRKRGKSKAA